MSSVHDSSKNNINKFRHPAAKSSAAKNVQNPNGAQSAESAADAPDETDVQAKHSESAELNGHKAPIKLRRFIDSREASIFSRIKAFVADVIIIFFAVLILSSIIWRPLQSAVWGKLYISMEAYNTKAVKKVAETPNAPKYYKMVKHNNEQRYYRDVSFKEKFIEFNVYYPLLPIILYFTLMWAAAGASLGQMYANNAVVMCEDDDKPNLIEAFIRSVIFVFSVGFFGVGALMLFGEDSLTLYDKICATKVIEIK